jgi:hypothetical protein
VLIIGAVAAVVAGGFILGGRLSRAVKQITAVESAVVARSVSSSASVAFIPEPARAPLPRPAVEPTRNATPTAAYPPASDGAIVDEDAPPLDEGVFLLEYFGVEVSLNVLGQLQTPDPEFEREMRELANERGEITERN